MVRVTIVVAQMIRRGRLQGVQDTQYPLGGTDIICDDRYWKNAALRR